MSRNLYKRAPEFVGMGKDQSDDKNFSKNEELKKFYINLPRRQYEQEVAARKDDIKRKSTGFYIFKWLRELFPNRQIDTAIDVGGNYGIFLQMLSEEFAVRRKICMDIFEPDFKIEGVEYLTGFAEETLKRLDANSVDVCLYAGRN